MKHVNRRCRTMVRSRRILSQLFLLCIMLALASCGGHDNSATTLGPQQKAAPSGNFNFSVISQVQPSNSFVGGGMQTDSTGHVTGVMHPTGGIALCFGIGNDLPMAGSIDASNHLTATISSPNGQTMTMTGLFSPDGTSITSGTYTTTATGCFAGDHGAIAGFQMQPFTGTYSGTFIFSSGVTINLSIPLTQSSTPDAHGFFEFAPATVTITGGSACGMTSATFDTTVSFASGGTLAVRLEGSDGITSAILTGVTTSSSTTGLASVLIFDLGPCNGQQSLSQLTRS